MEEKISPYKAEIKGECVRWGGCISAQGYGETRVDGVSTKAHRAVWEFARGKIPKGMHIDHLCRNKACVNVLRHPQRTLAILTNLVSPPSMSGTVTVSQSTLSDIRRDVETFIVRDAELTTQLDALRGACEAAKELREAAYRYGQGDADFPWPLVRAALVEWCNAHDAALATLTPPAEAGAVSKEKFEKHLKEASETVAKWPAWKQEILGGKAVDKKEPTHE